MIPSVTSREFESYPTVSFNGKGFENKYNQHYIFKKPALCFDIESGVIYKSGDVKDVLKWFYAVQEHDESGELFGKVTVVHLPVVQGQEVKTAELMSHLLDCDGYCKIWYDMGMPPA